MTRVQSQRMFKKLNALGYVSILTSAKDKRAKELYTTALTKNLYPKSMGFVETGGIILRRI